MSTHDANRRFARNLFSAADDHQGPDDDKLGQRADSADDDGLNEQRRWVADLFAGDDEDAGVLAGLPAGRTVGRTTPPRREPTPHSEFRFS